MANTSTDSSQRAADQLFGRAKPRCDGRCPANLHVVHHSHCKSVYKYGTGLRFSCQSLLGKYVFFDLRIICFLPAVSSHASRARFRPHRFPAAPHPRRLPALVVPRPATPPQAGPSPPVAYPLLPYPIKHKTRGALSSSSQLESGGVLPSQAVASLVLSALKGLTAVFGMGTGGSPSPLPPEIVIAILFSFPLAPSQLHNVPLPALSTLRLEIKPSAY